MPLYTNSERYVVILSNGRRVEPGETVDISERVAATGGHALKRIRPQLLTESPVSIVSPVIERVRTVEIPVVESETREDTTEDVVEPEQEKETTPEPDSNTDTHQDVEENTPKSEEKPTYPKYNKKDKKKKTYSKYLNDESEGEE